jgi:hypothetical protein
MVLNEDFSIKLESQSSSVPQSPATILSGTTDSNVFESNQNNTISIELKNDNSHNDMHKNNWQKSTDLV